MSFFQRNKRLLNISLGVSLLSSAPLAAQSASHLDEGASQSSTQEDVVDRDAVPRARVDESMDPEFQKLLKELADFVEFRSSDEGGRMWRDRDPEFTRREDKHRENLSLLEEITDETTRQAIVGFLWEQLVDEGVHEDPTGAAYNRQYSMELFKLRRDGLSCQTDGFCLSVQNEQVKKSQEEQMRELTLDRGNRSTQAMNSLLAKFKAGEITRKEYFDAQLEIAQTTKKEAAAFSKTERFNEMINNMLERGQK